MRLRRSIAIALYIAVAGGAGSGSGGGGSCVFLSGDRVVGAEGLGIAAEPKAGGNHAGLRVNLVHHARIDRGRPKRARRPVLLAEGVVAKRPPVGGVAPK
jgi:hypothetical protein